MWEIIFNSSSRRDIGEVVWAMTGFLREQSISHLCVGDSFQEVLRDPRFFPGKKGSMWRAKNLVLFWFCGAEGYLSYSGSVWGYLLCYTNRALEALWCQGSNELGHMQGKSTVFMAFKANDDYHSFYLKSHVSVLKVCSGLFTQGSLLVTQRIKCTSGEKVQVNYMQSKCLPSVLLLWSLKLFLNFCWLISSHPLYIWNIPRSIILNKLYNRQWNQSKSN